LIERISIKRECWWRTLLLVSVLLIAGCQKEDENVYGAGILVTGLNPTSTVAIPPTPEPTDHVLEEPTQILPTPTPAIAPQNWKDLPVLPRISSRAREIYEHGLSLGNNPDAFAKVGDCGSSISWFLGPFDQGPAHYSLGEYGYLEHLVEQFSGSFGRQSVAAQNGFTATSVFAPVWSDQTQCHPFEAPLACEYRVMKPSFAFIMLGTNDRWHLDTFEDDMRQIIEFSIEQGVVPIIGTKADNFEEDESINQTISRLAMEYEIPLWNYWLAVQSLPNQGLEKDGVHLTWGPVRFDDPENLQLAWPVRNLTAMQALDLVWRDV
jgi:hypothetical protein